MSDDDSLGEYWRDVRSFRQDKRRSNAVCSAERLREAGVEFEQRNHGSHFIIRHNGLVVDFWPTTGVFIVRDLDPAARRRGRGVFNLLDLLRKEPSK